MSETTVATPEPAVKGPSGADNLSFSEAFDAGFEALSNSPSAEAPVESAPEKASTPVEAKVSTPVETKISSTSTNPLDILTRRMTGQEDTKTAAITEDADIKAPDNLKPEAQTAWARLTKDLREARTQIKEFEAKASEAPVNSVEQIDLQNQLNALKTERDEYEGELRLSRLESTREYKQAVTSPLQEIQKEVSEISDLYKADSRSIYAAMAESDPAKRRALLKEATSAFDPVDALAVRSRAEDLQKVFARRDLLTKDVQTVLQMLDTDQKQEQESMYKKAQEQVDLAYKSEWENLQKENALLRPIEGNEAWNNALNGIQQQALQIENTELDPRAKAKLTFNAAAMPVVMNVFQDYVSKTQTRITELEALTKELRATLPSSGGSRDSGPEIPADLSFVEALERGMKR